MILKIHEILGVLQNMQGTKAKLELFAQHAENQVLLRVIKLALDPFVTFGVVKVPRVDENVRNPMPEGPAWTRFFGLADRLSSRQLTGNEAISALAGLFELCTSEDEHWMRAILEKRLGIGLSSKLFNRAVPGLVPEFEVSLAHPYESKRLNPRWGRVLVEPKLDGIRCVALIRKGTVTMLGRSGKEIENFVDTVGKELLRLPEGCYDGELIGSDFQSLMEQAYRKEGKQAGGVQFHIFDYLSLREWEEQHHSQAAFVRHQMLVEMFSECEPFEFLRVVPQFVVSLDDVEIRKKHDEFVTQGYEGAMVKNPEAGYTFGRSFDVMKLKAFHDVDLTIEALQEGTGKHAGRLGALVTSYKGNEVCVGSGLTDELREAIWNNSNEYIGRTFEVQYQEETKDGSLRFPTFVRFRDDK